MKWKIDPSCFRSKYIFIFLVILLFAAHLPFLNADPDLNISFSRGPFTDEGLNTIQIRNWVNHGILDLAECDNLLKTPLFGFPLALTYQIFGTHLPLSRAHVLILVLLAMLFIGMDPKHRAIMIIFTLVTLAQYQVFQFSHFSLAEMLSSTSVLLSIHFLARSSDLQFSRKQKRNMAVLAGIFLSLAYFIKIQFIFLVILLPVVQLIRLVSAVPIYKRMIIRQGFYISATLFIFLIFYLAAWYLPNCETYDYMMSHQSGEFTLNEKIWEYISFNVKYFFFSGWMQWFTYAFLFSIATGFILLITRHTSRFPILYLSSLTWFLLECHKLGMVYLPTRYQVSIFISMGLMISIVLNEILSRDMQKVPDKLLKIIASISILVLFSFNIKNYLETLDRRTYVISECNNYLKKHLQDGDIVIGAWAPSLTWESKSRAMPVWNQFLNFQDPINTINPKVIIAEADEQDSEQAYSSQGIILQDLADSIKTVTIGQWEVRIHWMKVQGLN